MDRFIIIIAIISLFFILESYILHRLFRNRKFVKYLPPAGSLILSVISFYLARTGDRQGLQDIARHLIGLVLFTGFIAGTLSAVFFDVKSRYKK